MYRQTLSITFCLAALVLVCMCAPAIAAPSDGWFAFDPKPDPFDSSALLDLRSLNEKVAGKGGFIGVKDGQFVHNQTGEPIRFWAVNGPPSDLHDPAALGALARTLAKRGVNMVRVHHGYFDKNDGSVDTAGIAWAQTVVEAMKAQGIYTHFSIYFPVWFEPKPGLAFLPGYDGHQHPFAALYFNPEFQKQYRSWWTALLTTPSATTGRRLIDDPAVSSLELINEDSFFFWTFAPPNVPDPELRMLEGQFGAWLTKKYGSPEAALAAWNWLGVARDAPREGRMAFRPLWNMFHDRTARDRDTADFLTQLQRGFYADTVLFLRGLGFKGVITCSNWTTADPKVLGPLDKYTYTAGDFLDRHGYFGCAHGGDNAAWSLRDGHTYMDRSALRFDAEQPGKPKVFSNPVMDPKYDGLPSMISETTFERPNRYRSEGPLYYAAYGALQGSGAIVQFALDGARWSVKPNYFMQAWTVMTPAMMGQFPAAAVLYRRGLIAPGDVLVKLDLKLADLLALKGMALAPAAALDVLRSQDIPRGEAGGDGNPVGGAAIDPLVHFAGRVQIELNRQGQGTQIQDLRPFIHRAEQVVISSNGQLRLDYGKGLLTINAPGAQGLCGALNAAGQTELTDVTINSGMDLGAIILVSMDRRPLATSQKMLLQVMSEEQASGFATTAAGGGMKRIVSIGHDPWLVRELSGQITLKRQDSAQLQVTALDANGYAAKVLGPPIDLHLQAETLYYWIAPR
jgi:hypothetical protein